MIDVKFSAALQIPDKDWYDLASRAIEPNVFHRPEFLRPAVKYLGPDAGLLTARGNDGRILAAIPLRQRPFRFEAWINPYAPDGTILVDRKDTEEVLTAVLRHLGTTPGLPRLLHLPLFPRTGPLAQSLARVTGALGLATVELGIHERSALRRGDTAAAAFGARAKHRKETARQRRRLAENGQLRIVESCSQEAIAPALDDFLELEASGWKGRAGTAMGKNARSDQFVRGAIGGLASRGLVRIVALKVRTTTIASGIVLGDGERSWFWKTAYDERLAKYSPGVQLALDVTNLLGATDGPALTDSCAVPGHPMIERIWRARRQFADRLISLQPGATGHLTLAASARIVYLALIHLRRQFRLSKATFRVDGRPY